MSSEITEMSFFHSNFMLQTPHQDDHNGHPSLAQFLPSSCTPQDHFNGVASLLGKRSSMAFTTGIDMCKEINNHVEDDLSDDGSQFGERKRRLSMEQVKALEKNFELGNKLEPERKMQLARALGLQPRQIAIWFQNRRARWKTKQLEKDYDILKRQFDAVKADNDTLQAQNQKLQSEIMALKNREPTESINLNKETEGSCSINTSSEIKLDIISTTDSPSSTNPRLFFPSSLIRPNGVEQQFFQNSSRTEIIQGPKIDQPVKEESSLSNMFCGVDDQIGFWPWLDQQQFN